MQQTIKQRDIAGWLIIDKPQGITSAAVVRRVKSVYQVKKVGHAGTLDPLATGVLAVAIGEATKTIPFVTESLKVYAFVLGKQPTRMMPKGKSSQRVDGVHRKTSCREFSRTLLVTSDKSRQIIRQSRLRDSAPMLWHARDTRPSYLLEEFGLRN